MTTSMRSPCTASELIIELPVDQNPPRRHVNLEDVVGNERDQARHGWNGGLATGESGCCGEGYLQERVSAVIIHTDDLTERLVMRVDHRATNEVNPIERVVAGGRKYRSRECNDAATNLVRLASIREADGAHDDAVRMYSGTLNPKTLGRDRLLRTRPNDRVRPPGNACDWLQPPVTDP